MLLYLSLWIESRLLHCSEEGWGLRPVLDLSAESLCQESNIKTQTNYESNQDRGLVYHIRSEECGISIFPEVPEQELLEICFQGQSIPILGSSFWLSTFTHNFYHMRGCYSVSSANIGNLYIELL